MSSTVPSATSSPPRTPEPGTDVDDMVRLTDRVLVMLDDERRVALVGEPVDGVKKDAVVSRMQSYRRLVEHVANTPELARAVRPDECAGLHRRKASCTVEREVSESHFLKEGEARQDLGDRVVSNSRLASLEPEVSGRTPPRCRSSLPQSEMLLSCQRTALATGFRRVPRQSGQSSAPPCR